jgi:hypothetical protein
MLEGDVEVGEDFPLRHQRQNLVHVRIGIDVVQAHPGAKRAQRLAQLQEARLEHAALVGALCIPDVEAIG